MYGLYRFPQKGTLYSVPFGLYSILNAFPNLVSLVYTMQLLPIRENNPTTSCVTEDIDRATEGRSSPTSNDKAMIHNLKLE